jgi:hypothetical protein
MAESLNQIGPTSSEFSLAGWAVVCYVQDVGLPELESSRRSHLITHYSHSENLLD